MRQAEFGFLGCYYATYLVWRPRDESQGLYISKPFMYNSEHPEVTTLGAVSWLQGLAAEAFKANLRHAPYQPPGPAALPGPEGGQSRGGEGGGNSEAGREGGGGGFSRHEGSAVTGGGGGGTLQQGGGGGGGGWHQRPSGRSEGKAACIMSAPPVLCPPRDEIVRGSFLGEGESGLVYAGLLNQSKAALKVGGPVPAGQPFSPGPPLLSPLSCPSLVKLHMHAWGVVLFAPLPHSHPSPIPVGRYEILNRIILNIFNRKSPKLLSTEIKPLPVDQGGYCPNFRPPFTVTPAPQINLPHTVLCARVWPRGCQGGGCLLRAAQAVAGRRHPRPLRHFGTGGARGGPSGPRVDRGQDALPA